MIDYLEIGPVPADEDCQQCGTPDYNAVAAREECYRFIRAIRITVGHEPQGSWLTVRSNEHDFGTYYEVNVKYDDNYPEAIDYAFKVESEAPTTWPVRREGSQVETLQNAGC